MHVLATSSSRIPRFMREIDCTDDFVEIILAAVRASASS
jgi:hypothetical protein